MRIRSVLPCELEIEGALQLGHVEIPVMPSREVDDIDPACDGEGFGVRNGVDGANEI
jgi:hypothetical protein